MKISAIEVKHISIPLKKTFKTALRTVYSAENTVVMLRTDDGHIGFGEAPPTAVITGDTNESIIAAITGNISEVILGKDIENIEEIMDCLHSSIEGNYSAKAAVDMAVYDLFCKHYNMPLYKLLGGYRDKIETDVTISVSETDEMAQDAFDAVAKGFTALKIKVGTDIRKDIEKVKAIRSITGKHIKIRLDANQGWHPKEAVKGIRAIEDAGLDIELVEQPVKAWDLNGLKFVADHVETPVMADESLFGPKDALKILQLHAADLLNIKLMKCGGIFNALKILSIAEAYGVECMIGSMIESKISLTAAAHLAAAKKIVTRVDLDAAILLADDPVLGGFENRAPLYVLPDKPGLGIEGVKNLTII